MARIKFGSLVTEGSGSLGGHTIQNSKGGPQWRTKPLPIGNPSAAQRRIRSFNPILQWGWRDLSEANRKIWNDFAPPGLSGHSIWMQYQFQYLENEFPFQLSPSKAALGPFGPELILNGTFINSDHWTLRPSWSISGGTLNFLSIATNRANTTAIVSNSLKYRLIFDISNAPGNSRILFADVNGNNLFAAPYASYTIFVTGVYCIDVTAVINTIYFALWSNIAYPIFSLDNLSLRQIL